MKTLYAIRDRIANDLVTMQMYSIFAFRNDAQATRYFADAILDEKSILNKHPDDYELVKVGYLNDNGKVQPMGSFHDDNGTMLGITTDPEIIITGSALIATRQDPNMEEQSPSVRLAR